MSTKRDEINKKVRMYQDSLVSALPDYCFAFEDGDKYVRQEEMIRIEE